MWLLRELRAFTGWSLSISRKLARIAPGHLVLVVIATMVSHLSRLFAFFLPFKIVILIGSPGVPRYFPRSFLDLDRETLVIGLGVATVLFYVLSLLADKLIDVCAERSADRVLEKADKLALFANQDEIVRTACHKFAESIAALIFAGLALVLIGFLHPSIAVLIVVWVVVGFAVAAIGGIVSADFRKRLEEEGGGFLSVVNATGFFASTALIVAEFIAGASFNILYAIVSLLLGRQVMQQLARVVGNAITLSARKPLINALFFRGHLRPDRKTEKSNDVWDLLAPAQLGRWLPGALFEATGIKARDVALTRWHWLGVFDVVTFEVRTGGEEGKDYLVRLYGSRKEMGAAHEAVLLAAVRPGRLPAPEFLGMTRIDGVTCLFFEKVNGQPIDPADAAEARFCGHGETWACEPPRDLALRFRRSHQLLDQRLAAAPVERLALAVEEPAEQELLDALQRVLEPVTALLSRMPLAIHNPDLSAETMLGVEGKSPVGIYWARWALEPIGAGWPERRRDPLVMAQWLDKAKEARADLRSVTVEQVWLASLASTFERLVTGQRYRAAVVMLPEILAAAADAGLGETSQADEEVVVAAQ